MMLNGATLLGLLPLAVFVAVAIAVTIYGSPADPHPDEPSRLDEMDGRG